MKKDTTRIDIEIYLVFIVLIGVSVFNAIYSTVIISRNQDASTQIMTVDVPSLQMLENANLLAIRSKMYATNWVYLPSAREDKEKLKTLHESEYPQLKGELLAVITMWDNNIQQDTLVSVFKDFDKLIVYEKQIMSSLTSFDDYEDPVKKFGAEEILETEILPRSAAIITTLNKVIVSRRMQADTSHNAMTSASRKLMWSVLGIAIMIVIVVLLAGFYLSNSIIVPVMKLKNYIQQMGKGEIPEINVAVRENAVGQMTLAVKALVGSVERTAQFANSIGDGDFEAEFQPLSKKDKLGNALVQMRESLLKADQENKLHNWEATGIAEINQVLRDNTDGIEKLSNALLKTLAQYIEATCGGFYLFEENSKNRQRKIRLISGYALPSVHKNQLEIGEGFVGQSIRNEQVIHIKDIPQENFTVGSAVGEFATTQLLVVPVLHQGIVYGALEFSSFGKFYTHQVAFMTRVAEIIGSAMASSISNSLTKNLLQETQLQADKLKAQEEKLRKTNDELSVQGELLKASKEELKSRNEDLKIKAELLQSQNERLEEATQALEIKAEELEQSNKYKSEFLANMSHELRTPLNSVLILAKLLAENKNHTLTEKEIEYSKVIHKSGTDLLSLINDILDLSKIEAGKIELMLQPASIRQIKGDMIDLFSPIAGEKKIELQTELHSDLPNEFTTDQFRLEQVIKNLLSNALKFTSAEGTVTLRIRFAIPGMEYNVKTLREAERVIEFSVSDTGIGIPKEKQNDIFEAFQQADGSTSRKYGGTGLGLSISKMLVGLLGGEMKLKSEAGHGSTFYVYLPFPDHETSIQEVEFPKQKMTGIEAENSFATRRNDELFLVKDDRDNLISGDRVLLIVEDDATFAKVLVDFSHEKKFKTIVTNQGDLALIYASQYHPSAILLDMQLPVLDGWTVLKRLKEDKTLWQIPVHVMSALDKGSLGIKFGALTYLRKPLDRHEIDKAFVDIENSIDGGIKNLLIFDAPGRSAHVKEFIDGILNCKCIEVSTVEHARTLLYGKEHFDAVMLVYQNESNWPGIKEMINWIRNKNHLSRLPIIVCGENQLNVEQKIFLNEYAGITSCDLQRENARAVLRETFAKSIIGHEENYYEEDSLEIVNCLSGRTVLISDDDMRNTYAISAILEEKQMNVIIAGNGVEAIVKLEDNPSIDIILLDIMMPEMDGFEVLRKIKSEPQWNQIPVIALTANMLDTTREKCMTLGASAYLTKPINTEQLVNLMEVWLSD
jgi:signal transduction histidine kinase/CheY-like chemotaxis protein